MTAPAQAAHRAGDARGKVRAHEGGACDRRTLLALPLRLGIAAVSAVGVFLARPPGIETSLWAAASFLGLALLGWTGAAILWRPAFVPMWLRHSAFAALALASGAFAAAAGSFGHTALIAAAYCAISVLLVLVAAHSGAAPSPSRATPSGVTDLAQDVIPLWVRHIEAARQHGDESMASLVHTFGALTIELREIERNNELALSHVDQLFLALQYQDRVSQMLEHARRDMERLVERIVAERAGARVDWDSGTWLQEMRRTYAMEEQRAAHEGRGKAPAQSQIAYF